MTTEELNDAGHPGRCPTRARPCGLLSHSCVGGPRACLKSRRTRFDSGGWDQGYKAEPFGRDPSRRVRPASVPGARPLNEWPQARSEGSTPSLSAMTFSCSSGCKSVADAPARNREAGGSSPPIQTTIRPILTWGAAKTKDQDAEAPQRWANHPRAQFRRRRRRRSRSSTHDQPGPPAAAPDV